MNKKLPPDAFNFYYSLGPSRSYQAVADKYGVSKRGVTLLAAREKWQERIVELEKRARERSDEKVVESIEEMNSRHLKVLRYIQSKSIEALKTMPIDSAMEGVKAFTLAVEKERVIRGQPGDRTAVDIEDVIKREYENIMRPADEDEWAGEEAHGDDAADGNAA